MKNIYLLGFMGTGKTAVGKLLAEKLGKQFVDLDDIIEGKEGIKITEIFAQKGELYFRGIEAESLKEIAGKEDLIVACGGGIVLKDENISIIEDTGFAVCLQASPEIICERTKQFTHRPLLNVENPKEKIGELLAKRAEYYAKIKCHIDTSGLSVREVRDKIIAMKTPDQKDV